MSGLTLGLFMDVSVLVFLSVAIYLALKLSKSLENFRESKEDFSHVIAALSANVDNAQKAIGKLKTAGQEAAADLTPLVNEARALVEEMKVLNEAGYNLAERLENLAERNGEIARKSRSRMGGYGIKGDVVEPFPDKPAGNEQLLNKPYSRPEEDDMPSFFINDRDYEEEYEGGPHASGDAMAWEDEAMPDDLQSAAERELYQALKQSKRRSSVKG